MKFLIPLITLLLSIVALARAQNIRDTVRIGEITVTAGKQAFYAGLKISRPDSTAMVSSLTTSLSDLLTGYTPVYIKDNGQGSEATASFRGTAASHAAIVWNGIKLNSPMTGYTDLSLMPLFFIDDVYLLHGGSSLAESSGALGGSIHLENLPAWNNRAGISGILQRGSFDTGNYMVKLNAGNPFFHSATRFYYGASDNDFTFKNIGVIPNRTDTLRDGGYHKSALLQEFYLRSSRNLVAAIRLWVQGSNRNLPQLMSYEGRDKKEDREDRQGRAQIEVSRYRAGSHWKFLTGINRSVMEYTRRSARPDYLLEDAETRETSLSNLFRYDNRFTSSITLRGSIEANYYQIYAINRNKNTENRRHRTEGGLMVHLLYKPAPRTTLFLLSRAEVYDGHIAPWIPAAGIEANISSSLPLEIKASVTRNYHKPTLNDLYWVPGGNPELLPEQGFTGECSLTMTSEHRNLSVKQELTIYGSRIDHWIIWQPSSTGASYWEAENLRQVDATGGEYDFRGALKWQQWNFRLAGNYAFTRTINRTSTGLADRSEGKQLIYIPRHIANLHCGISHSGWELLSGLKFTGRRYTQSSNDESLFEYILNPYCLTSLALQKSASFRFAEARIQFKVENLFNVTYQQVLWRPMPGRHCKATLAFLFGK